MHPRRFMFLPAALLALAAQAGELVTLDGKVRTGELALDASAVTVKSPAGSETVPLASVLSATFRAPEPPRIDNPLPSGFRGSEIGDASGKGSFVTRTFSLAGAGTALAGKKDSAFFVWHTLHGFSDMRARILDVRGAGGKHGAAGVSIRASLSSASPHATILVDSAGKSHFVYRAEHAGDTTTIDGPAIPLPCYVRLNRDGNKFTAEISPTGAEWKTLGEAELKEDRSQDGTAKGLRYTAFAGMVLTSGDAAEKGGARFDHVLSREPKAHPEKPRYGQETAAPAQWTSAPQDLVGKGVLLKSGTFLANAETGSLENGQVSFTPAGKDAKPRQVPLDAVAQVVFATLGADALGSIPQGKPGLLLMSGDFVEGRFRGVQDGQVKISSVIFGIQKFDLATHALGVVIAPPAPDATHYRLTLRDGSVIVAKSIRPAGENLVLDEPTLGPWTVARADVYRLAAPLASATPLAFVRPEKSELPAGFNPVATSVFDAALGSWTQLPGFTADAAIALATPSEIAFATDKPARALVMRVGVPARSPSKSPVTVIVRDETGELWRSAALKPDSPALAATVPLRGGKRVTIRVESPDTAPAFVTLGDPVIVRGE